MYRIVMKMRRLASVLLVCLYLIVDSKESMNILAIDAGTTGVTALMVSSNGEIIGRGSSDFEQFFLHPGWVEHDLDLIWRAVEISVLAAIEEAGAKPAAIGITNQRETIALWNRDDLSPARKAIVWQDRRTTTQVDRLRGLGLEAEIRAKTGLGLDPYFSSTKFLWLSENEPELWSRVQSGKVAIGTIDSYLVAKLTGGKSHITDASNASRTQLMNIHNGEWDDQLLQIFNIPESALPRIVPNYGELAIADPEFAFGISAPITGMAGDQQAALFGQAGFEVGANKCTYGTGAFILCNTGEVAPASKNGLLTTIAWQRPDKKIIYALEGAVFVAGAAVQWLRDGLGLIENSNEIEGLAASVDSSDGVRFVPALTGLGTPFWNPDVRGAFFGITRGTTKAHFARATLEGLAFQIRAVVDAIQADLGRNLSSFKVDGGAAANDLLMQLQADCLNLTVTRGKNLESTALGAAFLAGLGAGIWTSTDDLISIFKLDREFEPKAFNQDDYRSWLKACQSAIDFASD
jgi:glycerol kinase